MSTTIDFGSDSGAPCTICKMTIFAYTVTGDCITAVCATCHAKDYLRFLAAPATAQACSALHRKHTFIQVYTSQLQSMYGNNPEWLARLAANPPDLPHTLEELAQRMTVGLITGRSNKDSEAIKRACKQLGIKHTYVAIRAYLNTQSTPT